METKELKKIHYLEEENKELKKKIELLKLHLKNYKEYIIKTTGDVKKLI